MALREVFQQFDYGGRAEVPSDSGVVARQRWAPYRPADSLGAATLIAACSLGLDRSHDTSASVCFAVGESALRAAAWLRTRGAAVGHAASRDRLEGAEATTYQLAGRTRASRQSDKMVVTFATIGAEQVAEWLRPDRVAILVVGSDWPTAGDNAARALVVVGVAMGALTVFDPSGDGHFDEVSFAAIDAMRGDPAAAWEVLLVARPR